LTQQVDSLRLHFLRNVLATVPKGSAEMVAAIRTIFAQPSPVHVHDQLEVIAAMLGRQFPKVEAMLREAADTSPSSPVSPSATGRRSGARMKMSTRRLAGVVALGAARLRLPDVVARSPRSR
jgi:transposase-like protein